MVIAVSVVKSKRGNYFMTDEEAALLWKYVQRWGTKWQVMLGFALFRGMRIGEICAINLYDFQNENFSKLNVVLEKSHIADDLPLLKDFNELLRKYILQNKHTFKDGYLFPYYTKKSKPHLSTHAASSMFCKLRRWIAEDGHPEFLDYNKEKGRYRISWHSCRRWFETRIWEQYKDKMQLRDIMRYKHSKTVDVYIDPYVTWKNEQEILENTFSGLYQRLNNVGDGQTKLSAFA